MTSQAKREPDRTGKGPRVGHLDSLTGILKEMGCVYREMRYGHTAVNDGARLIFALRCMRDVLETVAIERVEARLDAMEGQVSQHGWEQTDRAAIRPN